MPVFLEFQLAVVVGSIKKNNGITRGLDMKCANSKIWQNNMNNR